MAEKQEEGASGFTVWHQLTQILANWKIRFIDFAGRGAFLQNVGTKLNQTHIVSPNLNV